MKSGMQSASFHEQCRTDRDNYITINWNNIKSDKQHNFRTYVESGYSGENINQFDFNSIMLYSSYIGDENFVHNPNIPVITKKTEVLLPDNDLIYQRAMAVVPNNLF